MDFNLKANTSRESCSIDDSLGAKSRVSMKFNAYQWVSMISWKGVVFVPEYSFG